jgi:hypothetical protein
MYDGGGCEALFDGVQGLVPMSLHTTPEPPGPGAGSLDVFALGGGMAGVERAAGPKEFATDAPVRGGR